MPAADPGNPGHSDNATPFLLSPSLSVVSFMMLSCPLTRPRVPEHAIMLNTGNRENGGNHENRETEKHQPGEPFDWGAILTEEPF